DGLSTGRFDSGTDHEPLGGSPEAVPCELFAYCSPPGDHPLHGPRSRGHVPRKDRRESQDKGTVQESTAPVHQSAFLGRPSGASGHYSRGNDPDRRSTVSHQPALGLPLPPPLSLRHAPMRGDRAGGKRNRHRSPGGVSPLLTWSGKAATKQQALFHRRDPEFTEI